MAHTPTVLIAEDDEQTRINFSRQIARVGYLVREVASGRAALIALRQEEFDLLIVDLSMPDMDGIELIREVRREFPHLPTLAVSEFLRGRMLAIAKRLGATETMRKEQTDSQLIPVVCRLLDR